MMTIFFKATSEKNKAEVLRSHKHALFVDPKDFSAISGSPFAYWVSPNVRSLFSKMDRFQNEYRTAHLGASTKNDFRYLRLAWEMDFHTRTDEGYEFFAKGGKASNFYADVYLLVKWKNNAHEIEAELNQKFPYLKGNVEFVLHRNDPHKHPGLTWPLRTTSGLGMRVLPKGCIFSHKGPAAFVRNDDPSDLLALLALTTSKAFRYLVDLQMPAADAAARSYEVGVIQRTPVPSLNETDRDILASLAYRAWSLKRSLDSIAETSHAFILPAPLLIRATGFDPETILSQIAATQDEIDDHAFRIYKLGDEERAEIEAWASRGKSKPEDAVVEAISPESEHDSDDDDDDDDTIKNDASDALNSWVLGVAFGRFDIRLATGARPVPIEPEPFGSLPARCPGMVPVGDPPFRTNCGILVDDPGHPDDLTALAEKIFATVELPSTGSLGSDASQNPHLSSGRFVPESFRTWLRREAFPDHIKQYSKSRRKAPIYWRLSTGSGDYAVWIYAHALTKDTLFRVQNDYVAPKLAHEQKQLASLREEAGQNPSAAKRRIIDAQMALVEGIQVFYDELKRVAPLWNPNPDDGVTINFAPLWRLVAHNKPWQKELKATWESLQRGDYDWAHLAMHLWPERVIPKCASDRSLAIAHGLEDVFWFQDESGKWKTRGTPTQPVAGLVSERTSDAVKASLRDLLNASEPTGGTRRPRRKA